MKRITTILIILTFVVACGQPKQKAATKSYDELTEQFEDVLMDSTSTWEQVVSISNELVESLDEWANDESNLKNRIVAQDIGYMAIYMISDKYEELKTAGKEVNYNDVSRFMDRIVDAVSIWFYSADETVPHLWRDHYYVCYQESEHRGHVYFHIMVTLPCEVIPEPTLQIFYPESAEGDPILIFSKYLPGNTTEEDPDNRESLTPDNWTKKNEAEEGFPMHAELAGDVVDKMLHYDVLYLMFKSEDSPSGDHGATEIARLSLNSFQAKWKEVTEK